jgi:uncharacterized protein with NRDE domain
MGKEKVMAVIEEVVKRGQGEEELVDKLFAVLDTDTLPTQKSQDFEEYIYQLRKSIFIPPIGSADEPKTSPKAEDTATATPSAIRLTNGSSGEGLKLEETPTPSTVMTGIYGTQRQTIILVDWEGNISFRERSLWDEKGHPIERGKGDMKFDFKIEGWNGESKGNEVHTHAYL